MNINKEYINKPLEDSQILGEDVSRGDIIYQGEDSKWFKASSIIEESVSSLLWIADTNGIKGEYLKGVRDGQFVFLEPLFIPGEQYFLDILPGKITNNRNNAPDGFVKYIGQASSRIRLNFAPSITYMSTDGSSLNGIPLPQDKYRRIDIDTPTDTWICTHNLNKLPSIALFMLKDNNTYQEVIGRINHLDTNTVEIKFSNPIKGYATFN